MTRNLLITGAGVDCTKGIGFPMAATLLPEIAAYIEGEGKSVDQTLRALLPNLRAARGKMCDGVVVDSASPIRFTR